MPVADSLLNLDANAGGTLTGAVRTALSNSAFFGDFANPSSSHLPGQKARNKLEQARESIADLVGCSADSLVFTSGGTESVLSAMWAAGHNQQRRNIFIAGTDHPGIRNSVALYAARDKRELHRLATDRFGRVIQELRNSSALIASVQSAHSETGAVLTADMIKQLFGRNPEERNGTLLHIDACQSLGRYSVSELFEVADMVSFSGHKIGAPAGIGLLYIRSGLALDPLFGGEQEWRRRGGTENLLGALLLAEAVKEHLSDQTALTAQWQTWGHQKSIFVSKAQALFPDIDFLSSVDGSVPALPQTIFFRIPGIKAHYATMMLDQQGIAVSPGTACRSGLTGPNETVLALGHNEESARGYIRISLPVQIDESWINIVLGHLDEMHNRRPQQHGQS